jgi:uncharacterized protein YcbK (DUF882 family)
MNTTMSRRAFLGASLAASGTLLVPSFAQAAEQPASRRLRFYNTHTAEAIDITYFEQGVYHDEALAEIDFILRDFRANKAAPMARGVIDLVHDITRTLDTDKPVHIISGYRSPETNALLRKTGGGGVAKRSLHMDGVAIDIRIPGRDLVKVRDAARSLQRGGVGFYTKENFVHVDTGRVRHWG